VLKVPPLNQFGSPLEIVDLFGGKDQYLQALLTIKEELYA
jgi:type I restriction enzyme R subunit